MNIQTFDNVWAALSETPEQAENMKLRAELVGRLNSWIKRNGLNQATAAAALGVSQPRVSELAGGKINCFPIDKLVSMMAHAGLHITSNEISEPEAA